MRKICVFVSNRSDWGLLERTCRLLHAHADFTLQLVLGELCDQHGIIPYDLCAKIHYTSYDAHRSMGANASIILADAMHHLQTLQPDCVLVLGDRLEALGGALAAYLAGIPVAHVHGGDMSGGLDQGIRDAITVIAKIHFPACARSYRRVVGMTTSSHVYNFGAPGVDALGEVDVWKKTPCILLLQHPVTTELDETEEQIFATLNALVKFDLPVYAVFPNGDQNSEIIETALKDAYLMEMFKGHYLTNLPRKRFLDILANASVIVGNSSAGIIEAPYFRTPTVDIGTRQTWRECGPSVERVPHVALVIEAAIHRALTYRGWFTNPYGDGHCAEQVVAKLAAIL